MRGGPESVPMRGDWRWLAARQHGAFSWRQVRGWLSRAEVRTQLDHARWVALHPGVFCIADLADELPTRLAAAELALGGPVIACLHTAAALHGFSVVRTDRLHLIDPTGRHLASRDRLVLHQWAVPVAERVAAGGFIATEPARTAVDLARAVSRTQALAVLDAALRTGTVSPSTLTAHCDAQLRRRGIVQVRELLPLADGRAESPMESHVRLICIDAGLPAPIPQFEVLDRTGRPRYRLDLAWPAWLVAVEYDGVEFHSGPRAVRRDLRRHGWLDEHGWRIVYATAEDVLRHPERLVRRIRLALQRAAA